MIEPYSSFGRYPKAKPAKAEKLFWKSDIPDLAQYGKTVLPYGLGKSYGDSCQNNGGVLLDCAGMNKLIDFNPEEETITVEAGVTLKDVLDFIVPHGFFLNSTPGTKLITVGGAVANDVHGKNHHLKGTFGTHVIRFELLRSTGERLICSRDENPDLFRATIGGLGLTGLITWVQFAIMKVPSPFVEYENIKYGSLEEFFDINAESKDYEGTVSWVDCGSKSTMGRGLYTRGGFTGSDKHKLPKAPEKDKAITFPFDFNFANPLTVKMFNFAYYHKQLKKQQSGIWHYNQFFYPLDAILEWNKGYGKQGFLQYQFVLPFDNCIKNLKAIFTKIIDSNMQSCLTVLKTFGDVKSPGMLSFPRPGVTFAIDFPMKGKKTLKILEETDRIAAEAGGVIYPAKDARMSKEHFRKFYPEYEEFKKHIDPLFESDFHRRVK
jgi:FAD/FMN-containing dehydrogenase